MATGGLLPLLPCDHIEDAFCGIYADGGGDDSSCGGGARAVLSAAEVAAAAAQRAPRARLTEYMLLLLELVVDEVWQESSGTAANRGLKTFRPHTSAVMPPQPLIGFGWIYYMIIVVY